MKVYVPKNHNNLLLSSIKHGECFWLNNELYIKINTQFYDALKSYSSIYAARLRDGVSFDFISGSMVLMEPDVAVLESSRNE